MCQFELNTGEFAELKVIEAAKVNDRFCLMEIYKTPTIWKLRLLIEMSAYNKNIKPFAVAHWGAYSLAALHYSQQVCAPYARS